MLLVVLGTDRARTSGLTQLPTKRRTPSPATRPGVLADAPATVALLVTLKRRTCGQGICILARDPLRKLDEHATHIMGRLRGGFEVRNIPFRLTPCKRPLLRDNAGVHVDFVAKDNKRKVKGDES